jgi:phospholipase C
MDQWLPVHRKADGEEGLYVMGYYMRADIPFQFALAEAVSVSRGQSASAGAGIGIAQETVPR